MVMPIPAKSSFEHSEGFRRASRHLDTQRGFGHLGTWALGHSEDTPRALKALRHSSAEGILGTWALRHSSTQIA